MPYTPQLGDTVLIEAIAQTGQVINLTPVTDAETQVQVRCTATDGRITEQWWNASSLSET